MRKSASSTALCCGSIGGTGTFPVTRALQAKSNATPDSACTRRAATSSLRESLPSEQARRPVLQPDAGSMGNAPRTEA